MKRLIEPLAIVLAITLAVAALVLSGITMYWAVQFRRSSLAAVSEARAALVGVSDYTIEFAIPFQQTFPIAAEVPLRQDFVVPIQTTLPFSAVVQVPVTIPILGTYHVNVPIETEVPVNIQVMIPISQTVEVETTVSVDTLVPVRITADQLGLPRLVQQVDEALRGLEEGLGGGEPSGGANE